MDEDVFVDLGEPVQPLNMSPVVVVQQHTPPVDNIVVIDLESSPVVRRSSVKKRKRQSVFSPSQKDPPTPKERRKFLDEDDDDGATCSICLEQWEMCGEHRLTSLKCGHLFGQSCIKRWLQECTSGTKSCPSCKTKATLRDFRFLYAKRLCALDNTENVELRSRLESTQSSLVKTQAEKNLIDFELKHEISKVKKLQEENEYLRMRLASGQSGQATIVDEKIQNSIQLRRIKLFLDKTIEISRESGCRCMSYSRWENMLYVSQKSTQNLFAGYGVRYVDVATLKPTRYLPVSAKQIRDLDVTNLSENDTNYLLTATMEKQGRLFDLRTSTLHQSFVVDEGQSMIWSCCYDVNEANFLYFGSGQGQVYLYDKRSPMRFINEFKIHNEHSPVINVASVGVNRNTLPYGGLLVCKLKEIVFYEFTDQFSTSSRTITVNIEGPFNAMSYDQATKLVLITTRYFLISSIVIGVCICRLSSLGHRLFLFA